MFDIVMVDGLYNVTVNGVIVDTFYSLADAEDHIVTLRYEYDEAFANIGSEFDYKFDEPWLA
jgi:acyl CoA:acetate/3-ketoacid CoA transferase